MEYIEASDESGASFDDNIEKMSNFYPSMEPREGSTEEKVGMSVSERRFLLAHMHDNNLIKGVFTKDGAMNLHLTYQGHSWLQEYRNNTKLKQAFRWVGRQLDKLFSSIVLPVIAAVVTVLVMKYFGISID